MHTPDRRLGNRTDNASSCGRSNRVHKSSVRTHSCGLNSEELVCCHHLLVCELQLEPTSRQSRVPCIANRASSSACRGAIWRLRQGERGAWCTPKRRARWSECLRRCFGTFVSRLLCQIFSSSASSNAVPHARSTLLHTPQMFTCLV